MSLSLSKEPAAAIKCSAVPRTLDISRRLLSDLALITGRIPPKGYKFFPELGHTKSALYFMNESISDFHSSKGTGQHLLSLRQGKVE
jgi:hypothetical protein